MPLHDAYFNYEQHCYNYNYCSYNHCAAVVVSGSVQTVHCSIPKALIERSSIRMSLDVRMVPCCASEHNFVPTSRKCGQVWQTQAKENIFGKVLVEVGLGLVRLA